MLLAQPCSTAHISDTPLEPKTLKNATLNYRAKEALMTNHSSVVIDTLLKALADYIYLPLFEIIFESSLKI